MLSLSQKLVTSEGQPARMNSVRSAYQKQKPMTKSSIEFSIKSALMWR